ncbi:hypothetical protein ACPVPU_03335 [Sphingomonas sp. CJ99]
MIAAVLMLASCGGAPEPEPVDAAIEGIADAANDDTADRAIPREKLPDFVETYAGGTGLTSLFGSNEKRRTGTLVYRASAAPADVITFHKASAEKFGFQVSVGAAQVVRDKPETSIEAKHADGRTLNAVVIADSPQRATVQINFTIPVA